MYGNRHFSGGSASRENKGGDSVKKTVVVEAPAKINLFLDITGKRADGYHLLHSVMQSIDLSDKIILSRMSGRGIYISCSRARIPCDENNLAHRAASRFLEAFGLKPDFALSIDLEKSIPSQAGLGGGSSDAAAVLVGLNAMFGIHADREALCRVGLPIGADVPFCIMGGTMGVTGIGERLEPLAPMPDCEIVLAKPEQGVDTASAFRAYDALKSRPQIPGKEALLQSLDTGDLNGLASGMGNVLEAACPVPEVRQLKERMLQAGALGAAMSGSGSAVYGLFDKRPLAKRCMRKLYELSESVFLVRPIARGVRVVRTAE